MFVFVYFFAFQHRIQIVDQHLTEMGIYRISGNAGDMQRLKKECDENVFTATYESTQEVHAVSGLLKLYFRELADPLFTNALYEDFIVAARENDASTREKGACNAHVHATVTVSMPGFEKTR